MQIQVRIHEAGALRNQRHAFSSRYTLVTELLQNGRRAGATRIDVRYDATSAVLCVEDDGHGLDDFQKLLTLHDSGWGAKTQAEERPFGVGFSKCLYAATRCVVASGRQRVDIDTAAALEKAAFEVTEVSPDQAVAGTRVELHGVDLPELDQRMDELCLGFPLPVHYNGTALRRPLAVRHLEWQASPIGLIHLAGASDGRYAHEHIVFLQGFCVYRPPWCGAAEANIVHLDPTQFMARLPDRDKLIDEDVQRKRIEAEVKACWRRTLEAAKASLPVSDFIGRYYRVMRVWGHLDLLNDLDVLPTEVCHRIASYPIQTQTLAPDHLVPVGQAPTRREIEQGAIPLVAIDPVDDTNGAHWMYARANDCLVIDWIGLHQDHWALRHVRYLQSEAPRVEPVRETHRTTLEGRTFWPAVILCETVEITLGRDRVRVTAEGVCHDRVIYIPDGETSGLPMQQFSSYLVDNDQHLEADCEADQAELAALIHRMRSIDPQKTLDEMLQRLRLGQYPLFHGKTFLVHIGVGGAPGHSIELVEDRCTAARPIAPERVGAVQPELGHGRA